MLKYFTFWGENVTFSGSTEKVTKVISICPLGTMNLCTRFHSFESCWYISVWTKELDHWPTVFWTLGSNHKLSNRSWRADKSKISHCLWLYLLQWHTRLLAGLFHFSVPPPSAANKKNTKVLEVYITTVTAVTLLFSLWADWAQNYSLRPWNTV